MSYRQKMREFIWDFVPTRHKVRDKPLLLKLFLIPKLVEHDFIGTLTLLLYTYSALRLGIKERVYIDI